jgi:hypothetical protein
MKMNNPDRCRICGAAISDDNPDGIGYTCRKVYKEALAATYFKFHWQRHRKIKLDMLMPMFIDEFKNTKFRKQFKKDFYKSVVEFYEERGYVSKKQLEIIESWLFYKIENLGEIRKEIGGKQADAIAEYIPKTKDEQDYLDIMMKAARKENPKFKTKY